MREAARAAGTTNPANDGYFMTEIRRTRLSGCALTKERHHAGPIRKGRGPEMNVMAIERVDPVFRSVVDDEVAAIEVLVMRQDQPLVGAFPQVLLHPQQLVRPRTWILPGRSGSR